MRAVFFRQVQPIAPRPRDGRLGDFFSDIANSVNLTSAPSLDLSPSTGDLPLLPMSVPLDNTAPTNIFQSYAPATSDSSWSGILDSVSNALAPLAKIAQTYSAVNAARSLPVTAAPLAPGAGIGAQVGSLLSGPSAPYLIGGGFILLALMVSGGNGKRR